MSEIYLVLLAGAIVGLAASFVGIMVLHRNRLQTHVRLRERVEEERTALQEDISQIDKKEFLETDAGKELLALSEASVQKFGYPRENLGASLKRHNYDLLKQIDEYRKRLSQSEERLTAMGAMQQESAQVMETLKRENTDLRLSSSLRSKEAPTISAQIEQDLRITLEEVARLQNQLAEAHMRFLQAEAEGINAFTPELRQTLSSTLQYVDLLLDESAGSLNPMQRNFLETIKASTARLNHVIEDLAQLTKVKAHSTALARDPVDLNSITKDAIDETSGQIRAKRIALTLDVPEDFEPIYADGEALRQILLRLLSNAGDASPVQGTVHLRVQTRTEDGREHLFIQVSDIGGGIPPEDLRRVFAPLYRAEDIPARGVGDTGMGLFIAKTLTEAQNGRIWVDTEPGVGSAYNVLIPIARATSIPVSRDE
jgi:signal transduction histidine kinase